MKSATRLCSTVRHGAASGAAANSPDARKNSGMRNEASAVFAATRGAGARPASTRNHMVWWTTTSRMDMAFAVSTHSTREPTGRSRSVATACVIVHPSVGDQRRPRVQAA